MTSNGPKLTSPNPENKSQITFESLKEDLDCPVCYDVPESLPIYQCTQGHIICNSCYPKLNNCPVCRVILSPQIRALTAEKILQKHRDVKYYSEPMPAGLGPAEDRDAQHNQFHQITAQPVFDNINEDVVTAPQPFHGRRGRRGGISLLSEF